MDIWFIYTSGEVWRGTIWLVFLRFEDIDQVIPTPRPHHQSTSYPSVQPPVKSHSSVSQSTIPSPQSNHATTINTALSLGTRWWGGKTCNMIPPALQPSATIFSTTGLTR